MTQTGATFECDRCGGDCGNGSIMDCLVVARLDETGTTVENLHFCRENGCDKKVLSKSNLAHYQEQADAAAAAAEQEANKE